jgi:hypothetical protein
MPAHAGDRNPCCQQLGTNNQQPLLFYRCPQPATSNQQPTTNNQQPTTNNQQPTTDNRSQRFW